MSTRRITNDKVESQLRCICAAHLLAINKVPAQEVTKEMVRLPDNALDGVYDNWVNVAMQAHSGFRNGIVALNKALKEKQDAEQKEFDDENNENNDPGDGDGDGDGDSGDDDVEEQDSNNDSNRPNAEDIDIDNGEDLADGSADGGSSHDADDGGSHSDSSGVNGDDDDDGAVSDDISLDYADLVRFPRPGDSSAEEENK